MIKINIVGDFMPIEGVEQKILSGETSNLIDDDTKDILNSSSFNIINLECPLTLSDSKTLKTGKNFKAAPKTIEFLTAYNFKVACLANNHIMDYDKRGLTETMKTCEASDINTIGISEKGVSQVYRHKTDGISVSFINAAETEFGSACGENIGFMKATSQELFYTIQEEKNRSKWVVLILHGGREFYSLPSPERQRDYRLLLDFGADAIVSHHTHVPSGYEWYKGKPIIYSLGNFIFPADHHSNELWYESLICQMEFSEEKIDFKLSLHTFNQSELQLQSVSSEVNSRFQNRLNELNSIIKNPSVLKSHWSDFVRSEQYSYLYMLNFFTKLRYKLYLKGILGKPKIDKNRVIVLLNLFRCQAHSEESRTALIMQLEKESNFIN